MSTHPHVPFSHSVWPTTLFASTIRRKSPSYLQWLWRCFPQEAHYADTLDVDGFGQLWATVSPYTLLDVFRLANIARRFLASADTPGDIFECGTAGGGTSLMLALLAKKHGIRKRVWIFDSFEGLPAPDKVRDQENYYQGRFAFSLEAVRHVMATHGVEDQCVFHKGWFSDTLPQIPADQRFCFGHVDGDLYQSAKDCLVHLHGRLSDSAAMVFDDYYDGSGGVFLAVNEAALEHGETVHLGPSCQAFFVKHASPASHVLTFALDGGRRGQVPLSLDALSRMAGYRRFLEANAQAFSTPLGRVARHFLERRARKRGVAGSLTDSIDAFIGMCWGAERSLEGRTFALTPDGTIRY